MRFFCIDRLAWLCGLVVFGVILYASQSQAQTATVKISGKVTMNGINNYSGDGLDAGTLNPKFLVLSVTYTPPGQKSNINYGSGMTMGSSSSLSSTFTNQTSVSATGVNLGGIFGNQGSDTGTSPLVYTQVSDSMSSVSVNKTANYTYTVPGPANSAQGVNHDYDIFWVWLNPVVNVTLSGDNVVWGGFSYDMRDPANEMDIVPLYMIWLKDPSTIPANVAHYLARSWDPTGVGGLTETDYAAILSTNPFSSNPSYVPDPTRFDLLNGQTFAYQPPPDGVQPSTQTYSLNYQSTTAVGTSAQSTYQVGFSLEPLSGQSSFLTDIHSKLVNPNTTTWIDKWSSTTNTAQTASLTITGPAFVDHYTGPTGFQVYKDNVYGTFMFYPIQ